MARHYSDIGFIINEYDYYDELSEIMEEYKDSTETFEVDGKAYTRVLVDEKIELWFRVIDGELALDSVEPHFRTGLCPELSRLDWVYRDDYGMSGLLKGKLGGESINLNVSSAALVPDLKSGGSFKCEIAAFAETFSLYEDVEDFRENCEYGDAFAEKAYVPTGCYDSFGKDQINQTPRAIISGIIKAVERRTNSFTDEEYYVITIESSNSDYCMLVDPELIYDEPVPGNVVLGKVWFSGKVIVE